MGKLQMMLSSCHEALLDPDDPTKYTINPWARDLRIIYEQEVDGKTVSRAEKLDEIIKRLNDEAPTRVYKVEVKGPDPRELMLKTSDSIERQLQLLSKLQGHIAEALDITLQAHILVELRKTILDVTKGQPEMRRQIARAIDNMEDAIGSD